MDLENIWQIALAAGIFVLVLIIAIWAMRRAGAGVRGKRGNRLAVAETRAVDKNRHLVLVQCDDEEHLLLIGGPQDIVVKANVGVDFFDPAEDRASFAPAPAPMQPTVRAPAFGQQQERREPGRDASGTRENRPTNFSPDAETSRPAGFARPQSPAPREPGLAGPVVPDPSLDRR